MVCAHALAMALAWGVLRPWGLAAGVTVLVGLSFVYALKAIRRPLWTAVRVDTKAGLLVRHRDGDWQTVMVLGDSMVSPWLTVLHFQRAGCRFGDHLLLLPDALDEDRYRYLSVWLRWGQAKNRR